VAEALLLFRLAFRPRLALHAVEPVVGAVGPVVGAVVPTVAVVAPVVVPLLVVAVPVGPRVVEVAMGAATREEPVEGQAAEQVAVGLAVQADGLVEGPVAAAPVAVQVAVQVAEQAVPVEGQVEEQVGGQVAVLVEGPAAWPVVEQVAGLVAWEVAIVAPSAAPLLVALRSRDLGQGLLVGKRIRLVVLGRLEGKRTRCGDQALESDSLVVVLDQRIVAAALDVHLSLDLWPHLDDPCLLLLACPTLLALVGSALVASSPSSLDRP
jgi:hypothetical protein